MHAKDFRSDNRGDGEGIEHVDEGLPRLDIRPPLAFIVEAVHYEMDQHCQVDR